MTRGQENCTWTEHSCIRRNFLVPETQPTSQTRQFWCKFFWYKFREHLSSPLLWLWLERYWYWVIGYWAIFTGIGGIFFVALTPNTIPIRHQSAPYTCQWLFS